MPSIRAMGSYLKMLKFSKICSENGIKFIGASPEMIEGMGDKAAAKDTMKKAGVPTIPGSDGLIDDYKQCKKLALKLATL